MSMADWPEAPARVSNRVCSSRGMEGRPQVQNFRKYDDGKTGLAAKGQFVIWRRNIDSLRHPASCDSHRQQAGAREWGPRGCPRWLWGPW